MKKNGKLYNFNPMFLSIIIPVYNTKIEFLDECLNSLNIIDFKNFKYEVIIVDDGSKDDVVLNYLEKKSSDYKVTFKKNGGVGSARNTGVENSIGKYVFFLDSDDKLTPSFNIFLNTLKDNDSIDVLYGNLKTFDSDHYEVIYPEFNRLTLYFDENIIPNGSFLKREVFLDVNGNDERFKILEDYDLWNRIAFKGFKIVHLNEFAYLYRKIQNGESLIQRKAGIIDEFEILMKAKNPLSKSCFDQLFIDALKKTSKKHLSNLRTHYYTNKSKELKPDLFEFFTTLYGQELYDLAYVSKDDIIKYLHLKLSKKPRKLNGLSLFVYAPNLYKFLVKCGAFSYKYNFI